MKRQGERQSTWKEFRVIIVKMIKKWKHRVMFFNFLLFIYFLLGAAHVAYGGSQARGLIRAIVAGLCQSHSNVGSEPVCDPHHSSQQRRILNPLSTAGDRTCNLMVPSRIR